MAMGFDLMLKNMLGIDPEELKQQATVAIMQAQEYAAQADARLRRAEAILEHVSKQNAEILRLLKPQETITAIGSDENGGRESEG